MDNNQFAKRCKEIVQEQLNNNPNITQSVTEEDIYIVWFCKVLQNNKALVSAKVSVCPYFEITYNGDTEETYVDVYKKDSEYLFIKMARGNPSLTWRHKTLLIVSRCKS